jgi:hypothetical protein
VEQKRGGSGKGLRRMAWVKGRFCPAGQKSISSHE